MLPSGIAAVGAVQETEKTLTRKSDYPVSCLDQCPSPPCSAPLSGFPSTPLRRSACCSQAARYTNTLSPGGDCEGFEPPPSLAPG